MSDGRQLKAWVSNDTKERFASAARCRGMSESRLLTRLVEPMLQTSHPADAAGALQPVANVARTTRLMVRLRPEDQALLRERAAARGMASATYVSVLTRAHLQSLSPLPKEELLALKRTVADLGIVGRSLNQIARAPMRPSERFAAARSPRNSTGSIAQSSGANRIIREPELSRSPRIFCVGTGGLSSGNPALVRPEGQWNGAGARWETFWYRKDAQISQRR